MKYSLQRIAVFCGSSTGSNPKYREAAMELGKELASRNVEIVFGGGKVGLMGILADAAMEAGGKVTGVIPHFLKTKEVAHDGLNNLILEDNMHDRKMTMNTLSDGVITLPGGFGTMEEFFEMLTWAQLGLHQKPIAVLNVEGFYDGLESLFQRMVDEQFLKDANRKLFYISDSIQDILTHMESYEAPAVPKWINRDMI